MGAPDEEEAMPRPGNGEERIFVSVRLRPMNDKEIARFDVSDWECINDTTVLYRNSLSVSERSMYPSTYSFDRVFGPDSSTRQVYEDGAKEVAISVVRGINSSVFAYGQTSSGKTYTMTGITEYAVADIYDYIETHKDREFVLKFSAMEIYNESVRDLLSTDTAPLRLLDDPERGTVVEKLTEETIVDQNHLKELLSICEAQRQIGETNLNEASSRSHQILRLTIESSAHEFFGNDKSSILASTVNFVDLAGSERASQSLSAGMRLKEGCHINRSLLTLGTVIRKLSKGKSGHVPFRDSKLTRILQSSLGGNARTAIICTMSPARIHVEQSRNTLLFASCAKEVTTNAQVNVVVSDKALVKQLQRELSRLESELRNAGLSSVTPDSTELLKEKDRQIEKLMKEVAELTQQRDEAKSLVDNLLQGAENNKPLNSWEEPDPQYPKLRVRSSWISENSYSAVSEDRNSLHIGVRSLDASQFSDGRSSTSSEENFVSLEAFVEKFNQTSSSPHVTTGSAHFLGNGNLPKETEEVTIDSFDQFCKEVQCIEVEESSIKSYANSTALESRLDEYPGLNSLVSAANRSTYTEELEFTPDRFPVPKLYSSVDTYAYSEVLDSTPDRYTDLITSSPNINTNSSGFTLSPSINTSSSGLTEVGNHGSAHPEPVLTESKEEKHFGNSPSDLSMPSFKRSFPYLLEDDSLSSRSMKINRSRSCRARIMSNFPAYLFDKLESNDKMAPFKLDKAFSTMHVDYQVKESVLDYGVDSESLPKSSRTVVDDVIKDIEVKRSEDETDIQFNNGSEPDEGATCTPDHLLQGQKPKGTTLRNVKNVGLDPMEEDEAIVPQWPSEFKRLQKEIIELWQYCNVSLVHRSYFFQPFKGDSSDSFYMEVELRRLVYLKDAFSRGLKTMVGGHAFTPASSKRALDRERHMLSRQMSKQFTTEERENLFLKWDIALNGNQRRLQLANLIWSKTDMDHIVESAALVAKLVGLKEQQEALRFGLLNFAPSGRKSSIWKRKDTLASSLWLTLFEAD